MSACTIFHAYEIKNALQQCVLVWVFVSRTSEGMLIKLQQHQRGKLRLVLLLNACNNFTIDGEFLIQVSVNQTGRELELKALWTQL